MVKRGSVIGVSSTCILGIRVTVAREVGKRGEKVKEKILYAAIALGEALKTRILSTSFGLSEKTARAPERLTAWLPFSNFQGRATQLLRFFGFLRLTDPARTAAIHQRVLPSRRHD